MGTYKRQSPLSAPVTPSMMKESHGRSRSGKGVTQARARAQRTKLDTQVRAEEEQEARRPSFVEGRQESLTRN